MAKETVRYPDALVARIEAFVTDSSAFESKSEYHRFASEFLLSVLDPGHEPSVLGYGEIFDDLQAELDGVAAAEDTDERFLEAYIRVRRHLLHGEVEDARVVVDEWYDVTDVEAVLLDELIAHSHAQGTRPGPSVGAASEPKTAATTDHPSAAATDHPSDNPERRVETSETAVTVEATEPIDSAEPVESDGGQNEHASSEPTEAVESEY